MSTAVAERTCAADGCETSLAGKRSSARFCSQVCRQVEWHRQNPGQNSARVSKWQSQNRERYLVRKAEYRRQNRDLLAAQAIKYYHQNREQIAVRAGARNRQNPEKAAIHRAKRRALKRNAAAAANASTAAEIVAALGRRRDAVCAYCPGGPAQHLEHVVPLVRGGAHNVANLVWACAPCNLSKFDRLLSEWAPALAAIYPGDYVKETL